VPVDATFRLERNEWRGVAEARLVLRDVRSCEPPPIVVLGEEGSYLDRALTELDRPPEVACGPQTGGRELRDRRGRGIAATVAALVASGEPVLVACCEASARLGHLRSRLGGFALCSHAALAEAPQLADAYRHVVVLDPPASAGQDAACRAGGSGQVTHLAWGQAELRFAQHIHEQEYGLRAALATLYRTLRDLGGAEGAALEAALQGAGPRPRSPALAGRLLRVLTELGLVSLDRQRRSASVLRRAQTELERSSAYRAYQRQLEDGRRYLESDKAQAA
jgi:single-stranded-DNA-specific exonuclease